MASTQQELVEQLEQAQKRLEPQLKSLRNATGALQQAVKLAKAENLDALAMQKALEKLQQAGEPMADEALQSATAAFAETTQSALDALAYEFASDLRQAFIQRGKEVGGRPPILAVEPFVLQINIGGRKAQWFYGKEALARPIALSIPTIMQVYDQQTKTIVERTLDVAAFVAELYNAWKDVLEKRTQRAIGGRVNLVDVYSQVVLNRQSARFWNAPSRSNFRDYERAFFVRDLVLAHAAPTTVVDGQPLHLRLAVATKSQAESASRSIWLPQSAVDGEYYATITFEQADGRVAPAAEPKE